MTTTTTAGTIKVVDCLGAGGELAAQLAELPGADCAAEFGVAGWSRARARAREETRIRMHAVCPGCTDTELLRDAIAGFARDAEISAQELTRRRIADIPIGRLGRPEDIAALITQLAGLRSGGAAVAAVTGGEVLA